MELREYIRPFRKWWWLIIGATLIYRASPWHPLAQYPGPFTFRLSKLALAWATSDGKQFEHLKAITTVRVQCSIT